jgi:hypothetical protein
LPFEHSRSSQAANIKIGCQPRRLLQDCHAEQTRPVIGSAKALSCLHVDLGQPARLASSAYRFKFAAWRGASHSPALYCRFVQLIGHQT